MSEFRPSFFVLRSSYFVLLAVAWTVAIAGISAWEIHDHEAHLFTTVEIQARHSFDKDLVYRRWATGHGGVYVPVTEETPPNPYLTDVEERDITTPSGRELTLVNPAYMTRQVHELGREEYGLQGHITSLDPIRPENAPDPWEVEALRSFERGETEVASLELIEGEEHLRLMRPLITEKGCLNCHAQQGYEVGDIRGGISMSVPMAPLRSLARRHLVKDLSAMGLVWMAGLAAFIIGARNIGHSIRERDRIAVQLAENQELLTAAFNMAGAGGWEVDAETLEVRWTEQTYRIHELPAGERPTLAEAINFFLPEDRPKLERAIQRALEHGEPWDMELRFITAKGRYLWIHTICEPKVVDGKTVLLSGIFQDITGRKNAELALREGEKKYRALFDNATDAVFIVQNGVIRFANPVTEEILGLSQEELAWNDFSQFIHEDDRAMVSGHHDQRLRGESPPDTYSFRIVDIAGNTMWVELKATALPWDEKPATLCFVRDITERRRTEIELEKHRGRLEELVEERTAELRQAVNLMAGRENRMADLKEENRELWAQLAKYEVRNTKDENRR